MISRCRFSCDSVRVVILVFLFLVSFSLCHYYTIGIFRLQAPEKKNFFLVVSLVFATVYVTKFFLDSHWTVWKMRIANRLHFRGSVHLFSVHLFSVHLFTPSQGGFFHFPPKGGISPVFAGGVQTQSTPPKQKVIPYLLRLTL